MKKTKKYNYNMWFGGNLYFIMSKSKKIKKILISTSLLVTASFPIIGTSIVNSHISKLDINKQSSSSHSDNSSSSNDDIKISSTNKQSDIVNTGTTTNADVSSYYQLDTSTASKGYSRLKVLDSDGKASGISIKIPNFSNESETAQATATQILGSYNGIPSNIVTTGTSSNISNIIDIDTSVWKSTSDSSNPSKIFNLGAASTYNNNYRNNSNGTSSTSGSTTTTPIAFRTVTSTSALPAFNQVTSTNSDGTTTNTQVTEQFLDDNGILALQVTVVPASINVSQNPTYQSFYLLIPGFGGYLNNNAMSNNPMLPSSYYSSGVSSVSNSSLVSFLSNSFSTSSSQGKPTISVVSRNNDNLQGILNFTSNFTFTNTSGITFSNGFGGVTDNNASSLSATTGKSVAVVSTTTTGNNYTNIYTSGSTSYDMNFTISGFQPISAISDTNVIIITGVIIATVIIICVAGYFTSKAIKAIRYRNAL